MCRPEEITTSRAFSEPFTKVKPKKHAAYTPKKNKMQGESREKRQFSAKIHRITRGLSELLRSPTGPAAVELHPVFVLLAQKMRYTRNLPAVDDKKKPVAGKDPVITPGHGDLFTLFMENPGKNAVMGEGFLL